MNFSKPLGHETQKQSLINNISGGRIPHAQLFKGDDGFGLLELALEYAKAVVCKDSPSSIQRAELLVHPDIHFVFPTAITAEIKSKPTSDALINNFRDFYKQRPYGTLYDWLLFLGAENKQGVINVTDALNVIKKVSLMSFEGGWKCVIIWHAEKMTLAASNKLLKSIEEPPQKTLFLILCSDEYQILSTIRSRCQKTSFGPISENLIFQALKKSGADKDLSLQVSKQAKGNFGTALKLINESSQDNAFEAWFVRWVRLAFKAKGDKKVVQDLKQWGEEIASSGVETQKKFLNYSLNLFRFAVMEHYSLEELNNFYSKTGFKLKEFASYIHGQNILNIVDAIEKSHYELSRNGSPLMIFTDLAFLLTRLLHKGKL